ncbi:MAG TPA: TIR domain-containing protein [Thermoleophilaceae bacterium]
MSDGSRIAAGRLLATETAAAGAPTRQVGWSPDGRYLTAGSAVGVAIWDVERADELHTVSHYHRFAWAPDCRTLIVAKQFEGDLREIRVDEGFAEAEWPAGGTHEVGADLGIAALSWHPSGDSIALLRQHGTAGSKVGDIEIRDARTGALAWIYSYSGRRGGAGSPYAVEWSPDGSSLAFTPGGVNAVVVLDATGGSARVLEGHANLIADFDWSPDGALIATASSDRTIRIWNVESGRTEYVLEGHREYVATCSFSSDGRFLASLSADGECRIWATDTWEVEASVATEFAGEVIFYISKIGFHPNDSTLAVPGPETWSVQLLDVESSAAKPDEADATHRYVNATVILAGDYGVGKSGLGLVLSGQDFEATDSTHGRRIWLLDSDEVEVGEGLREIREVFLWDLAGQPGYRLVHQLHLSQADIALVVFDSRSEVDAFAGVGYWARALRQAEELRREADRPMARFLVAARVDRSGPAASRDRIDEVTSAYGFDGYFATSARRGDGIDELAAAIRRSLDWAAFPRVSSSDLFLSIKAFLVAEKASGRVLASPRDLMAAYREHAIGSRGVGDGLAPEGPVWKRLVERLSSGSRRDVTGAVLLDRAGGEPDAVFATCVGRLESQALIRRLSFGDYVLLQPELLDVYASSIVNAARAEPDGLGSIAEDDVTSVRFPIDAPDRLHGEEERLLVLATVEELIRSELALREPTEEGTQLVFPSALTRDWPETPEVPDLSTSFRFEGPLENVYSTLVVRLSRSGRFRITEIWRTAVTFESSTGGSCGLILRGQEAKGELGLFFDDSTTAETRLQFDEYVESHLARRAVHGSIERRRVFACGNCGEPLSDGQVKKRRERGFTTIGCPVCEHEVSLLDWRERLPAAASSLAEMDEAADSARDLEVSRTVIAGKREAGTFDVFLCHNVGDKDEVKEVAERLKERGLLPWLDVWELPPGQSWIQGLESAIDSIKSAAVFVGSSGMGPWQRQELNAFLLNFVERGSPVIPVLLPTAAESPQLPVFLRDKGWVDFREPRSKPLAHLIWGITGERSPELEEMEESPARSG